MKYNEYQVWFHAFNNAILGLSRREDIAFSTIKSGASDIADFCVTKFQTIEQLPESSDLSKIGEGFDLKGIVEKVVKNSLKENNPKHK